MKRISPFQLLPMLLAVGFAATSESQAAATNTSTNTPSSKGTNAAPAEIPIPESVFTVPRSRDEGVDPFFPQSRRLAAVVATQATPTTKAPPRAELSISGFSVRTGNSPLVIINGITFGAGDKRDVITPQGRVTVRCLAISMTEKSASLEVNGERRELFFRVGK